MNSAMFLEIVFPQRWITWVTEEIKGFIIQSCGSRRRPHFFRRVSQPLERHNSTILKWSRAYSKYFQQLGLCFTRKTEQGVKYLPRSSLNSLTLGFLLLDHRSKDFPDILPVGEYTASWWEKVGSKDLKAHIAFGRIQNKWMKLGASGRETRWDERQGQERFIRFPFVPSRLKPICLYHLFKHEI